ncbi:MAG TPA: IS21 family transposase [Desulfotomaculum sp.]|nr:IS21 family transposase [Desulfotomaculum sp.]
MTEVATLVDIMRLKEQGLSKRAVAKMLGISRDTVSKYWNCVQLETGYGPRPKLIDPYRDYITQRLDQYPALSAQRLFEEIQAKGYTGSERTVRRHVASVRPRKHREYKPFETLPGEQAQADWGHFGTITVDGATYKLYAFVFTLCWSRVSYVEFVVRTDAATFLSCLYRALIYIGGVPREIVFDNAKVVVSERVGKIVRFNENLLHFALSCGFTPRACWVYDAESKGKVESQIKYVRRGFFYGRKFTDLRDLNRQVRDWCSNKANTRVHGTTGEIPRERLNDERDYLRPTAPSARPFVLEDRLATRTSLISVEGNQYSVPSRWARRRVRFRRYENHLELLDDHEVVDTIRLEHGRGKRIIRGEHYPEHEQARRRKTPANPLQAKFEGLAPEAAAYLQGLSRSRTGSLRNQMEKIIALAGAYSPAVVSRAMRRALEYRAFGYGTLKGILKRYEAAPESLPEVAGTGTKPLSTDLNVQVEKRDLSYYGTLGVTR